MERSKDPWGNFLENVGFYNPLTDPKTVELNKERISYWISKGAQPTDTVHNLLVDAGIVSDKKRNVSALGKKVKEAAKKAAEEAKAPKEEAPKEESKAEGDAPTEAPAEEAKPEEKPAEPAKEEDPKEEAKAEGDAPAEDKTE